MCSELNFYCWFFRGTTVFGDFLASLTNNMKNYVNVTVMAHGIIEATSTFVLYTQVLITINLVP
jgi:hypothetical protein